MFRRWVASYYKQDAGGSRRNSHVETTHDMPELNDRRYHKEELVSFLYSYGYKTYLRVYKVATAESRSVIIWLASRMKSRAGSDLREGFFMIPQIYIPRFRPYKIVVTVCTTWDSGMLKNDTIEYNWGYYVSAEKTLSTVGMMLPGDLQFKAFFEDLRMSNSSRGCTSLCQQ